MTTPPAPAPPGTADPGQPPPPPPPPPPPAPPAPPAPGQPDPKPAGAELEAALAAERQKSKDLEQRLARIERANMTEQEKAVATAREEGKAEAAAEHAQELAAAEFRAQAAGRVANPDAALAVLDLAKLLKDGKPDKKAIGALVEQLAAVPPPPGRVPAGPRDGGNANGDLFRDIMRGS
jgi:flagellar biosynthesis/type III secretory pathway protein FliH